MTVSSPNVNPDVELTVPVRESNLADEFECTATGKSQEEWFVKSLWIYPVKSCHGIELQQSRLVATGLEYDRQYTFAEWKTDPKTNEQRWIFITQRQYPLMARIKTEIKTTAAGKVVVSVGYPTKSALGGWFGRPLEHMATFDVPLDSDEEQFKTYPLEDVRIWKEVVPAYNLASLIPPGLPTFLGVKNRLALFRMPPSKPRSVYRCAPTEAELGYQPNTAFADAYPLHIINMSSVRELNGRLENSIPELSCVRFRSNIIVSGPAPFQEDDWKIIKLGENTIYTSCRTARCNLPNVDQETGEKHPSEPAKTMRSYRCIDPGTRLNACMGMQAVPAVQDGLIKVGDPITVLTTGEHFYIEQ
ncbi:MOSC domain-containing protein [Peziza echinospora]|nr:MOSC domain-containing protein [Peziza echinospora]